MILIDSQKFACSACINGHRSSSCQHTERPLFEIKKKGRPVTQCERCRELRKTRSYHSKCLCEKPDTADTAGESAPSTDKIPGNKRKKASRTAPEIPTLPNGIRDLLDASKPPDLGQEESRKRFKAMLNSCKCGCDSTKRCRCNGGDLLAPIQEQTEGDTCCAGTSSSKQSPKRASPSYRVLPKPKKTTPASSANTHCAPPNTSSTQTPPTNSCCAPKVPETEHLPIQYRDAPIVIKPLSLPPGSTGPALLPSIATWTSPIPSLHTHSTTTMDSCGCGDGCGCAGCAEHRGAVAAAAAIAAGHHSCPDRCGTCQDQSLTNMHTSIESLLARAVAKLPPPPAGKLSVFQSATGATLVVMPPLSRTGGKSSCCAKSSAVSGTPSSDIPARPSALFAPLPSQLKQTKNAPRRRRQIRSPSPSDDDLTDADAEGEIDPDNESAAPAPAAIANNDWALAQFDVDVELELELAVDAIHCAN